MDKKDKKLILVDEKDRVKGYASWQACHQGEGRLHRAFSIYIFNDKGELLIQKRSQKKPLWPGFWANSCCSHPRQGERVLAAAQRRLKEELGFSCPLKKVGRFVYRGRYGRKGSEYESCWVLQGKWEGKVKPNPEEVAEWRWVDPRELEKEMREKPESFAPWFKMGWKLVRGGGSDKD